MSPALPPEIVSDVLSRLPVKSLLRFRSLSKPLCSTIDGPDFAKRHLHHHSKKSLVLTSFDLYSVESPSLERAVKILDHPLKNLPGETLVIGSCNGLLCLYNMDTQVLALWNKSTGKHLLVPSEPIAFPRNSSDHDKHFSRFSYGLCHDSVRDDYKIVRIVQFHNTDGTEARVYSTKSSSWRKISGGFAFDLLYWRSGGVLADGALHWPANRRNDEESYVIVAFDPETEKFREVPTPPGAPYRGSFVLLVALENRLCVVNNAAGKKTDVWIMKECWGKLLSVPMPLVNGSLSFMIPVAYLSNGDGVLLLKNNEKFLGYDLKRKTVNDVRIEGLPDSFDLVPYVDSLVNPLPNVVTGDDGGTVEKRKGGRGRRNKKNAAKRDEFLSKGFKLVL